MGALVQWHQHTPTPGATHRCIYSGPSFLRSTVRPGTEHPCRAGLQALSRQQGRGATGTVDRCHLSWEASQLLPETHLTERVKPEDPVALAEAEALGWNE